MSHYVEAFLEGREWGWQCLDPGCRAEATGFEDLDAAEVAGAEHAHAFFRTEFEED